MVTAITDPRSRSLVFPWRGLTLILWTLKEAHRRVSVYTVKVICTCVIIWFFEPLWVLSWSIVTSPANAHHLTRSYSLNDFWKLKRLQRFIHLTALANLIHLGSRTQVCTSSLATHKTGNHLCSATLNAAWGWLVVCSCDSVFLSSRQ